MSVQDIRNSLSTIKNEEKAKVLQKFFKTGPGEYGEGDVFCGVRVPELRKLAKAHRLLPRKEVHELLHSRIHEERLLALFILVDQYSRGDDKARKSIYDLYLRNIQYINNWDLVDTSALYIVGAFLLDRDKKPLYRLAKSKDLWERRIAIMSTFFFIRKNRFTDTLNLSKLLLQDQEDLIHKAVGWMLREIGKRDLKTEESFLKAHYKTMPRTMLRYAIEKFPEKKRLSYLKGTI